MKKLFLSLLITAVFLSQPFDLTILGSPVYASESTPSADIASKLKEFQKAAASKAAELKELIAKKLSNKAFIGSVASLSNTSITLSAKSGPKMVTVNQDTVFESNVKSKVKFSQNSLNAGTYIAVLGDADDTGVLTAKKIILEASPSASAKTYLWGQIIAVSEELLTLRDNNFKNIAASFPNNSKAKLNDYVIATGAFNENNIFEAGFVYVIPEKAVLKPKKTATPSAKTATSSAK